MSGLWTPELRPETRIPADGQSAVPRAGGAGDQKAMRDISSVDIRMENSATSIFRWVTGGLIGAISSRQSGATLRDAWLPCGPAGYATSCRGQR
jgi:hypothetical protein